MGLFLKRGQINPSKTTTAIVKIYGLPENIRTNAGELATETIKTDMSQASDLSKKNKGIMQKKIKRETTEKTIRLSLSHPVVL
jgi:hypothetical protein